MAATAVMALVPRPLRRGILRWAMRKNTTGMPDITTMRKIPEHLTFPLRRNGTDLLPAHADQREKDPVTLLGRRFALGEIDEDEYWRRMSVLNEVFGTESDRKSS